MRALLHVAARTLVERRNVLAAAAVAALLPLLAPLLPGTESSPAADARDAAATIIGAGFALVVALLHGATCIARDLRERRMSFYLARPLSSASLWFGKVLAGVLLSGATLLIAWLPTTLLDPQRAHAVSLPAGLLGAVLAVLLGGVVLGHALGVMLSSRSVWLAFDVAALAALAAWGAALIHGVASTGEADFAWAYATILAGAALAGLVLAGLAQVAFGRTDSRAGHRALSLVVWGALAAALVPLTGYTGFLLNPTLRSVTFIDEIVTAPGSSTVLVSCVGRWRNDCASLFAVDTSTGASARLARPVKSPGPAALSGDGSRAAWQEARRRPGPVIVAPLGDLRAYGPERAVHLAVGATARAMALSDDGRLLAVVTEGIVSVFEVDGGRLVTAARRDTNESARLAFVSDRRLRIETREPPFGGGPMVLSIAELDLAGGGLVETGRLELPEGRGLLVARGPGYATAVLREWRGDEAVLTLVDGRTLTRSAELARRPVPLGWHIPFRWGVLGVTVLTDGRIVVGEATLSGARLTVFDAAGVPTRTIDLGHWRDIRVGAELLPGQLAVALSRSIPAWGTDPDAWDAYLSVDVESGDTAQLGAGMAPWAAGARWYGAAAFQPASVASRLVLARGRVAILHPGSAADLRTVVEVEKP
jgi:hypothetical protein